MSRRTAVRVLATTAILALVVAASPLPRSALPRAVAAPHPTATSASAYDKVMVIAEENEPDSAVIGSAQAPYLNGLATAYGQATDMQAGYPTSCPSLAAYLLITSGSRDGICDDKLPKAHHVSGDNIFRQVAAAGKQWREYAESMPSSCYARNSSNGVYLVRHAPPPYYASEAQRCAQWDVPLGTTTSGALHQDIASGLPAYSFVTPNACDDMHGAASCTSNRVARGDAWLASWLPRIIAGSDFQGGHLVVVITWDEGSRSNNHIPTLVIAPTVHGVRSSAALTHCSTARATEEILDLPLLGCAGSALSLRSAFPI
jgi:hypothetical protein